MRKVAMSFALLGVVLAPTFLAAPTSAQIQIYPTRPIRMIVGFPPGGVADVAARIVSGRLSALLGQQVFVENRPGASGTLAAGIALKAAPDGYTLFLCPGDLITLAPLKPHMDFDPGTQLRPIAMIASNPLVVAANAKAPFNNIKEMLVAARTRSRALEYATPGPGTENHIVGEWIATAAHVKLLHVPYTGGAAGGSGVAAGFVPLGIFSPPVVYPALVDAGKVKVLALTGKERPSFLPPSWRTLMESGVPVHSTTWLGVFAPPGAPDAVLTRVDASLAEAVQEQTVRKRMNDFGMEPKHLGTSAFAAFIRDDTATYARVIRETGIHIEQ
jgi:tripartite-type tricarboxylate transporter receptor subunit TctC